MAHIKQQDLARICIEGLIHYAAERQSGFEKHQPAGLALNPETRNERTRELISGIADLYGLSGEKETCLQILDERLLACKTSFGIEILSTNEQGELIKDLLGYSRDLSNKLSDPRQQMLSVSDHLEDMVSHIPWDLNRNGLYHARDWINFELPKITAHQNILFTRIILGAETGPAASDFVGGSVRDPDGVRESRLFDDMSGQYPEVESWPAICTVYRAGRLLEEPRDATEMDLDIMRRYGDRFVSLEGISVCVYPVEMTVSPPEHQESQGMDMQL